MENNEFIKRAEDLRERCERSGVLTMTGFLSPAERYQLAAGIGFPDDLFFAGRPMRSLSGGERVKLQMAGLLLAHPDILLLDEPSNDIDLSTLQWLEKQNV